MVTDQLMDRVPMWGYFIGMSLITLASLEVGHRLGTRRRRIATHEKKGPVGTVVGATIGLLGFMVALTLSSASSRFDSRKEALIEGVNAIETAHRVAGLVPEPEKSETRKLLREYLRVRIDMPAAFGAPDRLKELDARVRNLEDSLWSQAEALATTDRISEVYSLFSASLNEVFHVHNKRLILGAHHRIPFLVWGVLILVTIISMISVGFTFGLTGSRSTVAGITLALTFAMVMSVIFDLDQPGKGLVDVNQRPMIELYERLASAKAASS